MFYKYLYILNKKILHILKKKYLLKTFELSKQMIFSNDNNMVDVLSMLHID